MNQYNWALNRTDHQAVPPKGPLANNYVTTYQENFTDFQTKFGKNFGKMSMTKYEREPVETACAGINILVLTSPVFEAQNLVSSIAQTFGNVLVDVPIGEESTLQSILIRDHNIHEYGYLMYNFPRTPDEATHYFHPQAPPSSKLPFPDVVLVIDAPQDLIHQRTVNNPQLTHASYSRDLNIDDVLMILTLNRKTVVKRMPATVGERTLVDWAHSIIEETRLQKLKAVELLGATSGTLHPVSKTHDPITPGLDHGTRQYPAISRDSATGNVLRQNYDTVKKFGTIPDEQKKQNQTRLLHDTLIKSGNLSTTAGILEGGLYESKKSVKFN
eukprot:GDKK01000770.1.p1 GENE.GDKK01000770.1~~GDKK01000770.1.p1  ORF type:complete len:340 (-),score=68.82 GDKK01000770.1:96-1082(-)